MERSSDLLLERLNMISKSSYWPTYYISKASSIKKFNSHKGKSDDKIFRRIQSLIQKKNTNLSITIDRKNKSVINQSRRNQVVPTTRKRVVDRSMFFNEDHLKVLRMIPKEPDKLLKKSNNILIRKKLLNCSKNSNANQCIMHEIEVQTNFIN